ncbi:MAG: DUF1810 family protein, partial [Actinobacteria bacterium]|nr:DUF1810 family protein [Actinomycetota bacterium]
FPQIQLGTSALSEHFAIKSHDEVKAYLQNETLRSRYLEISTEVLRRLDEGVNPTFLMGGTTDRGKLISSATLFEHFALHGDDQGLHSTLAQALTLIEAQRFARCALTLKWIDYEVTSRRT